jgi:hypothetical protein
LKKTRFRKKINNIIFGGFWRNLLFFTLMIPEQAERHTSGSGCSDDFVVQLDIQDNIPSDEKTRSGVDAMITFPAILSKIGGFL